MTAIRRPGAASVACLFALGAGLIGAHLVAPQWAHDRGLDVWNYSSADTQLRAAAEHRDEVEAGAERAAARRAAANLIAAKLVAGETSLSAAADEVAEVFADDAGTVCILETRHAAVPSARHRFARHLIERTGLALEHDPHRAAAVAARLEAEYRELSAH
ncbi:MAG: hypothetical protein FJ304_07350 [Planctomycetes bacterium]|nr:hypothetical protein [Planctomycetota bacterium]